ncbi:MAG: outer membrane protein [Pseudomonadota bacterium]
MNRVLLGTIGAIAMATSASAADLAPRPYTKAAPIVAAAYSWSGFYVGVHAGYAWMDSTDNITAANAAALVFLAPPPDIAPSLPLDPRGFIGGGQVGYNWQISPTWLIGLEADFSGTNLNRTVALPGPDDFSRIITANEKMDWFGTVRGRVGVTFDRTLLYATGGLAYGHVSLSTALTRITGAGCAANNCQNGSITDTRFGWTVGGGVEWAFADNWSVRGEYLYYDLGTISHAMTDPQFPAIFNATADLKGSIARAGLNYKFNWGSAVVARY